MGSKGNRKVRPIDICCSTLYISTIKLLLWWMDPLDLFPRICCQWMGDSKGEGTTLTLTYYTFKLWFLDLMFSGETAAETAWCIGNAALKVPLC